MSATTELMEVLATVGTRSKEPKCETLPVRISNRTAARLKYVSRKTGLSRSDLVRMAIEHGLPALERGELPGFERERQVISVGNLHKGHAYFMQQQTLIFLGTSEEHKDALWFSCAACIHRDNPRGEVLISVCAAQRLLTSA